MQANAACVFRTESCSLKRKTSSIPDTVSKGYCRCTWRNLALSYAHQANAHPHSSSSSSSSSARSNSSVSSGSPHLQAQEDLQRKLPLPRCLAGCQQAVVELMAAHQSSTMHLI